MNATDHGAGKGPTPGRTKPMVFAVDDDPNILRSLRIVLMRSYIVEICDNPSRAIAEIRTKKPDIIILDIKMPVHDGFWVFSEIRKFDRDVPIIFNSAYQDALPPEDVQAFVPFAHLPKNGNLSEFQEIMARAAKFAGW